MCTGAAQNGDGVERVCELHGRDVLGFRVDHVCFVPDQHVFRGIGVLVSTVPGERALCVRECFARVLLLQERVCACGGLVHLPDL